jgi:hypothetical protein
LQTTSTKLVKITDAVSRISEYDDNETLDDTKQTEAQTYQFSIHGVYHRRKLQPDSTVNTIVHHLEYCALNLEMLYFRTHLEKLVQRGLLVLRQRLRAAINLSAVNLDTK